MAQIEADIAADGVQLVWVLEADSSTNPGTAESCRRFVDSKGSTSGLCVGDGQTMPLPLTFDRSPFAEGRGFDILVRRSDMRIIYLTTHGTPGGNENLRAAELLEAIRSHK